MQLKLNDNGPPVTDIVGIRVRLSVSSVPELILRFGQHGPDLTRQRTALQAENRRCLFKWNDYEVSFLLVDFQRSPESCELHGAVISEGLKNLFDSKPSGTDPYQHLIYQRPEDSTASSFLDSVFRGQLRMPSAEADEDLHQMIPPLSCLWRTSHDTNLQFLHNTVDYLCSLSPRFLGWTAFASANAPLSILYAGSAPSVENWTRKAGSDPSPYLSHSDRRNGERLRLERRFDLAAEAQDGCSEILNSILDGQVTLPAGVTHSGDEGRDWVGGAGNIQYRGYSHFCDSVLFEINWPGTQPSVTSNIRLVNIGQSSRCARPATQRLSGTFEKWYDGHSVVVKPNQQTWACIDVKTSRVDESRGLRSAVLSATVPSDAKSGLYVTYKRGDNVEVHLESQSLPLMLGGRQRYNSKLDTSTDVALHAPRVTVSGNAQLQNRLVLHGVLEVKGKLEITGKDSFGLMPGPRRDAVAQLTSRAVQHESERERDVVKGRYYTVKQGDCLSSISAAAGLKLSTLWDHEKNSQLRKLREQPNILFPQDHIFIPEVNDDADESVTFQLRLLENMQPRAKLDYTLEIEGLPELVSGTTDDNGNTEKHIIPWLAQAGVLTLHVPEPDGSWREETHEIKIGHLDPISTDEGVVDRLVNLGYLPGNVGKHPSAEVLDHAILEFRRTFQLKETTEIDEELRRAVEQEHGS